VQALGDLPGRLAVALAEHVEDEVLPDPHAVARHRGVGGAAHELRRTREQGEELAHRRECRAHIT
jgi:hypothetical protein